MLLGYIIGDKHPCLKQVNESELSAIDGSSFVIIVGYELAVKLFGDKVTLESSFIQENIYYTLSFEESEQFYQQKLNQALKEAFRFYTKDVIVKRTYGRERINGQPLEISFNDNQQLVTLSDKKEVIYYSSKIQKFLNREILSKVKPNTLEHCFFPAVKCITGQSLTLKQLISFYQPYGDIELYLGVLVLNWLSTAKYDTKEFILWQNIYAVEKLLSNTLVKIDRQYLVEEGENNQILNNIYYSLIDHSYVCQQYKGTHTVTGRIFVTEQSFSLQTLGKQFRKCVIAQENYTLYEFDYQQFEYYILSQVCNFNLSSDPHLELSLLLFSTPDKRQTAKSINYSILYGKNLENIFTEFEIIDQETKQKLLDKTKPILKLEKQLKQELEEEGFITNYFGRKIYPEKKYALVNNYVQSMAADILCDKILKVNQLYSNCILLQNHDSILTQLLPSQDPFLIKQILESPFNSIEAKVDIKTGNSWGEMKELEIR